MLLKICGVRGQFGHSLDPDCYVLLRILFHPASHQDESVYRKDKLSLAKTYTLKRITFTTIIDMETKFATLGYTISCNYFLFAAYGFNLSRTFNVTDFHDFSISFKLTILSNRIV